MVKWNNVNQGKLRRVLIEIHPNIPSLRQFIKDDINEFDESSLPGEISKLDNWAEALVTQAKSKDWIGKLYQLLCDKYPNHSEVRQLRQDLEGIQSPEEAEATINTAQKLAECLWKLDYTDPEEAYGKAISRYYPAIACLIGTTSDEIQRWMLKRLAKQIRNFVRAEVIEIDIGTIAMQYDSSIDGIWKHLGEELTNGRSINYGEQEIIEHIRAIAIHQPVVIAFQDVQEVDNADDLVTKILVPLMDAVRNANCNRRAGLFIYLAGDLVDLDNFSCAVPLSCMSSSGVASLLRLEDLDTIPYCDIEDWFYTDAVCACIEGNLDTEAENHWIQKRLSRINVDDPEKVITKICKAFALKLADIKPYWDLRRAG
jgi:hypothetical protein